MFITHKSILAQLFTLIVLLLFCLLGNAESSPVNSVEPKNVRDFINQLSSTELEMVMQAFTIQLNALTTRKCQLCFRVCWIFLFKTCLSKLCFFSFDTASARCKANVFVNQQWTSIRIFAEIWLLICKPSQYLKKIRSSFFFFHSLTNILLFALNWKWLVKTFKKVDGRFIVISTLYRSNNKLS